MLFFVVVFFFSKQKTADEMRISDWSSDVCSSDLPFLASAGAASIRKTVGPVSVMPMPLQTFTPRPANSLIWVAGSGAPPQPQLRTREKSEIGRASCRERVCQYV